jgi:hypothetical protein
MKRRLQLIIGLAMALSMKSAAIQHFKHDAQVKTANQWEVVEIHFPVATLAAQPEDAVLIVDIEP